MTIKHGVTLLLSTVLLGLSAHAWAETKTLLNVSYDPTREFYREFNQSFSEHYQQQTGI
ncbi:hypothetical protein AAFF31_004897, partial [Escherichia coli]